MEDDNMSCFYNDEEENYEFLNYADIYVPFANSAENHDITSSTNSFCNFSERDFAENTIELNNICKKLKHLIELLFNKTIEDIPNDSYHSEYINFWLNNHLKKSSSNSTCAKNFFQTVISKDNANTKLREIKTKIRDIKHSELSNMNILNILYEKYHDINIMLKTSTPLESTFLQYADTCVQKYMEGKRRCTDEGTKFCKALRNFRDKYEKINLCSYDLKGWGKKSLPQLTSDSKVQVEDCETSKKLENGDDTHGSYQYSMEIQSNPDTNVHSSLISASSVVGICLVSFVLYKFTSFGPWLKLKITGKNRMQHNLDDENDQLLHRTEYDYMNSHGIEYNVAYNSL
ncbi:PIR Superfamily Protein [Plasmodium ovale wallikeri]|uniref:PIR Superfamily Protein n=1 Tax=Plasmodium ovale wallikeri TaxID=864142 RepID=A0A1A9A5Y1_PLAOA|nr:PIR Superfamily Protein [Plasmodium ovale wallikeri]SBT54060.1 PIR Superfamily Protein [Plasmodium ovale wallikeri]